MQLPKAAPYLPSPATPQAQSLYLQIAAHASGNALFLGAGVFLYAVWTLLADFRDPMLWALLCSAALRDVQESLVQFLASTLSADRSLLLAICSLALMPLKSLTDGAADASRFFASWRALLAEAGGGPGNKAWRFFAAGRAALHLTRERRLTDNGGHTVTASQALFSWLLRAIMLRELCTLAWHSWELALVLLTTAAVALAGVVWLGPMLRRKWREGYRAEAGDRAWHAQPVQHADQQGSVRSRLAQSSTAGDAAAPVGAEGHRRGRVIWNAGRFVVRAHRAADHRLHAWLLPQVNSLVSLGLITVLLVGPLLLSSFMAFQISREARDAVLAVREAIPTNWTAVANDSRIMRASYIQELVDQPWVREYQQQAYGLVQRSVPPAVAWLQGQVDDFAEQHNLTQAVHDVRMLYASFQPPVPCTNEETQNALIAQAKANAALHDAQQQQAELLMAVAEKQNATATAVARWQCRQRALVGDNTTASSMLGPDHLLTCPAEDHSDPAIEHPLGPDHKDQSWGSIAGDRAGDASVAVWSGAHPVRQAEKAVVAADAELAAAQAELARAKGDITAATEKVSIADDAVERCTRGALLQLAGPDSLAHHDRSSMQVLARTVLAEARHRLVGIFTHLRRLELGAAVADVKDMGMEGVSLAKDVVTSSADGDNDQEFSAVQRLAKVAMQPLLSLGQALGRFAMSSIGSTTNVAMSSGRSVLNIGKGAVTWALQFCVFVGLLYFLLNLETDPLTLALRLMPVSEHARRQTRLAVTNALRGVFVSSLKLMVFHALFTWLTLRAAGTHLVYTCTLGTAVFTALPIVPVWVFALPGTLQLALQGNLWGAALLFIANFAAGWADDVLLDDIPGSNSYLIGMGVAGGLSTFDNPLQGVLLGPLIISLMSALYNLWTSFVDQGTAASSTADLAAELANDDDSDPAVDNPQLDKTSLDDRDIGKLLESQRPAGSTLSNPIMFNVRDSDQPAPAGSKADRGDINSSHGPVAKAPAPGLATRSPGLKHGDSHQPLAGSESEALPRSPVKAIEPIPTIPGHQGLASPPAQPALQTVPPQHSGKPPTPAAEVPASRSSSLKGLGTATAPVPLSSAASSSGSKPSLQQQLAPRDKPQHAQPSSPKHAQQGAASVARSSGSFSRFLRTFGKTKT